MLLELKHIYRSFGKNQFALNDISFSVKEGDVLAMLGESGSGKSTLLRIIAGFERIDRGELQLAGKLLENEHVFVQAEKRSVGLVFQDYALFPHLTVERNIAYGQKKNTSRNTEEWLELVGLPGMGKRFPHQLSGGQQQRVAIARSLAAEPRLLLLDEPFSNLDDSIKSQVRSEIRTIIKTAGTTAVFVTHDTRDCMAVADDVVILQNGSIVQQGSPKDIYNHPRSAYAARIFGEVNLIEGDLAGKVCGKKSFAIRPQHILPGSTFSGTVLSCRFDGDHYDLEIKVGEQQIHMHSEQAFVTDAEIKIDFPLNKIIL